MKTLSQELLIELGATSTRPGYLVYLKYTPAIYLSTLGTISYAGQSWYSTNIKVSGVSIDGTGSSTANLTLENITGAYGALILNQGASDKEVTILACYAEVPEAVQVFSGVVDGATISETSVSLNLVAQNNKTLYSPRVFISKPTFNFLQPAGTKIVWGNETFVLERA